MCHMNKIEATKKCGSHQQHDAPIWPSCCTRTEMQRPSDAVPPTSFNMHVDMVLVPCALRACVLCAIVMRYRYALCWLKISHHDNFIRQIFFHRPVWD